MNSIVYKVNNDTHMIYPHVTSLIHNDSYAFLSQMPPSQFYFSKSSSTFEEIIIQLQEIVHSFYLIILDPTIFKYLVPNTSRQFSWRYPLKVPKNTDAIIHSSHTTSHPNTLEPIITPSRFPNDMTAILLSRRMLERIHGIYDRRRNTSIVYPKTAFERIKDTLIRSVSFLAPTSRSVSRLESRQRYVSQDDDSHYLYLWNKKLIRSIRSDLYAMKRVELIGYDACKIATEVAHSMSDVNVVRKTSSVEDLLSCQFRRLHFEQRSSPFVKSEPPYLVIQDHVSKCFLYFSDKQDDSYRFTS